MALQAVQTDPDASPDIPLCPTCGRRMETVYTRSHQIVGVCRDCHARPTVPASAWEVARVKLLKGRL